MYTLPVFFPRFPIASSEGQTFFLDLVKQYLASLAAQDETIHFHHQNDLNHLADSLFNKTITIDGETGNCGHLFRHNGKIYLHKSYRNEAEFIRAVNNNPEIAIYQSIPSSILNRVKVKVVQGVSQDEAAPLIEGQYGYAHFRRTHDLLGAMNSGSDVIICHRRALIELKKQNLLEGIEVKLPSSSANTALLRASSVAIADGINTALSLYKQDLHPVLAAAIGSAAHIIAEGGMSLAQLKVTKPDYAFSWRFNLWSIGTSEIGFVNTGMMHYLLSLSPALASSQIYMALVATVAGITASFIYESFARRQPAGEAIKTALTTGAIAFATWNHFYIGKFVANISPSAWQIPASAALTFLGNIGVHALMDGLFSLVNKCLPSAAPLSLRDATLLGSSRLLMKQIQQQNTPPVTPSHSPPSSRSNSPSPADLERLALLSDAENTPPSPALQFPILQHLPDGRKIRIIAQHKAAADGNCGFRSVLGRTYLRLSGEQLTRQYIVNLLKQHIEQPNIAEFITKDLTALYQNYIAGNTLFDLPKSIRDQFQEFKNQALQAGANVAQQNDIDNNVQKFCRQKKVLLSYLNNYLIHHRNWPHLQGSLAAFATILNITIHCFQKQSDGSLLYVESGQSGGQSNTEVFILQNNEKTHFDRLEVQILDHVVSLN